MSIFDIISKTISSLPQFVSEKSKIVAITKEKKPVFLPKEAVEKITKPIKKGFETVGKVGWGVLQAISKVAGGLAGRYSVSATRTKPIDRPIDRLSEEQVKEIHRAGFSTIGPAPEGIKFAPITPKEQFEAELKLFPEKFRTPIRIPFTKGKTVSVPKSDILTPILAGFATGMVEAIPSTVKTIFQIPGVLKKGLPSPTGEERVMSAFDIGGAIRDSLVEKGTDPVKAERIGAVAAGGIGVLDAWFTKGILRFVVRAGIKQTNKQAAAEIAWVKLGRPKTIQEAEMFRNQAARELSPDYPENVSRGTADETLLKEINNSVDVFRKEGIPSRISSEVNRFLRTFEMTPAEFAKGGFRRAPGIQIPFTRTAGLLPGTRPVGGRLQPRLGLTTEEVEEVGRGIVRPKPIPKEPEPLAQEARKIAAKHPSTPEGLARGTEEFVDRGDLIFQGGVKGTKSEFWTTSPEKALAFAQRRGVPVGEIRVARFSDVPQELRATGSEITGDLRTFNTRDEMLKITDTITVPPEQIKIIGRFDAQNIKQVKLQLTDFYKREVKGLPAKEKVFPLAKLEKEQQKFLTKSQKEAIEKIKAEPGESEMTKYMRLKELEETMGLKGLAAEKEIAQPSLLVRGKPPREILPSEERLTFREPIEARFAEETPLEFAVSKGQKERMKIVQAGRPLADRLDRIELTPVERIELFNAMDDPQHYVLSESLKAKGGGEILDEARELNRFLTQEKTYRNLLEKAWDDDTYLRTLFENIDGSPASAEKIARMKNAAGATFREQLTGLRPKIIKEPRTFATADLRDEWLKQFGLRTKRDFVESVATNYRITKQIASRSDTFDSLRQLAKGGDKDIKEVYDPFIVKAERTKIRDGLVAEKNKLLNALREQKLINRESYETLKKAEKEWFEIETKTIAETQEMTLREAGEYVKSFYDDVDLATTWLGKVNKEAKDAFLVRINNLNFQVEKKIKDYFGEITSQRGRLIDEGWRDAGDIIGAQELRGIMLKKQDFEGLKELVKELQPSSIEDFAKGLRYFQATGDLFQLPVALEGQISLVGGIKGTKNWLKAVSLTQDVTSKQIIDAAEFIQQGRYEEFDKFFVGALDSAGNLNKSSLQKFLSKIPGINSKLISKYLIGLFKKLEKYQWQGVMIPTKTRAWLDVVEIMKKKFPNKSEREIKVLAGRAVNDNLTGQNWEKLMVRNPKMLNRSMIRAGNIILFAKDRLTGILRMVGRETVGLFKGGVTGAINRRAAIRKILYGLGLAQVISLVVNGRTTFENDDPDQWYKIQTGILDEKGNPYYLDILGYWGQTYNLINRPLSAIRGKVSGPARAVLTGLSDEGIKMEGFLPVPFSWRNISETAIHQFTENETPTFGVAKDLKGGGLISLGEFSGLAGTFAAGKTKRASISRLIREDKLSLENIWNYLRGGKAVPVGEEAEIKDILKRERGESEAERNEAERLFEEWNKLPKQEAAANFLKLTKENPLLAEKVKDVADEQTLGLSDTEKAIKSLGVENGERAKWLFQKFNSLETNKERADLWMDLAKKKIITEKVAEQINFLLNQ